MPVLINDPRCGCGPGLKDRVEALGGRLSLDSPPGAGTALDVVLPLGDPSRPGRPAEAAGPPQAQLINALRNH